jgi:hypothetical protein
MHEGKPLKLVIIDSEGMNSTFNDSNQDTNMIFLLSILLSSYFIYNSMTNIDESALESLSLITRLSNQILIKENQLPSTDLNSKEISQLFPTFLWIVRDFSLKLIDEEGKSITNREYLETALKQQRGISEITKIRNEIRKLLKEYFHDRDCFTLVRPVEKETDLQNLEKLQNHELRPKFLTQIKQLRDKIFTQAKPKMLNGSTLNGDMLLSL